jgi:hypothetical protein
LYAGNGGARKHVPLTGVVKELVGLRASAVVRKERGTCREADKSAGRRE